MRTSVDVLCELSEQVHFALGFAYKGRYREAKVSLTDIEALVMEANIELSTDALRQDIRDGFKEDKGR